jgi:hypothetical protein
MIGDGAKLAIVLGVAAAAALGVAGVAMAKSPAPSPTPPPGQPPPLGTGGAPPLGTGVPGSPGTPPSSPVTTWTPAAQIAPGQRVRVSVAAPDVAQLAQSIGSAAGYQGWLDILANPTIQSVLQAKIGPSGQALISAWGPNPNGDGTMYPSPVPPDWPTDDLHTASEFHAEFVYGGSLPLVLATIPIPVSAWVPGLPGYGTPYQPPPANPPLALVTLPLTNPQPGGPQAVALHVGQGTVHGLPGWDVFVPGPFPALPVGQAWSLSSSWAAGPPGWLPVRLEQDGTFTAIQPGRITLAYGVTDRGMSVGGSAIVYVVTVT